jgi:mercuric reductase
VICVKAVSPEAGEIIQATAIVIRASTTIHDLSDQLFPYLTKADVLKLFTQTFTKDLKLLSCYADSENLACIQIL